VTLYLKPEGNAMSREILITAAIISLFIVLIFIFILAAVLLRMRRLERGQDGDFIVNQINALRQEIAALSGQSRIETQQKLDTLINQITSSSQENFRAIQNQFRQSAGIIKEVTERLTRIDETNRQVLDFSAQLQSLENILKNPKQRGILGEYFLETLLANVLQPNQYKMQYRFPDGDIVDAAIFYRDKIIPVDAKFSLEKYNRIMETRDETLRDQLEKEFRVDVKNRIDETARYVKPGENTTEFAFMFIPAEGVYYNLLIYNVGAVSVRTQDLIEYAFSRHVIIVSPTSFFAYLETVLQGLKAQSVEDNVRQIIKRINELGRHLVAYEEYLGRLGKNLSATVSSYNSAVKEFKKVDRDIYRITEGESGGAIDPILIDRPVDED
jgi:DNA recombination protein RmuC